VRRHAVDRHLGGPLQRFGRPSPDPEGGRPPQVLRQQLRLVGAGSPRFHGVGHVEVEAGPAQRREVLQQDVADQGVLEAQRPGRRPDIDQEAVDDRRLELLGDLGQRAAGGPGQQRRFHLPSHHGGDRQQFADHRGQAGQPPADHVAHRGRHVQIASALLEEQAGQLPGIEGVALGPSADPDPRPVGSARRHQPDQLRGGLLGQAR
jgi:hypothetical protein